MLHPRSHQKWLSHATVPLAADLNKAAFNCTGPFQKILQKPGNTCTGFRAGSQRRLGASDETNSGGVATLSEPRGSASFNAAGIEGPWPGSDCAGGMEKWMDDSWGQR